MTRKTQYFAVAGIALVCVLLFLLASASENSNYFAHNYRWLLALNAAVALGLLVLVGLLLARLYQRYRLGKFGAKLMMRLVLLFALVGIVPGALIYIVSVQFVSHSIETWFDVNVESALLSGLNLGRSALDQSLNDLKIKTKNVARELRDLPEDARLAKLVALREQGVAKELVLFNSAGKVVHYVGRKKTLATTDMPAATMFSQVHLVGEFVAIENVEQSAQSSLSVVPSSNNLRLRALVLVPSSNVDGEQQAAHFLELLQPVPTYLSQNADELRVAYSQYQQRSLARSGLRKIYLVTLTLTLLLAMFGAMVSAFLISGELARPLLLLAEGTKAVAEGDLSPRPIVETEDELGVLTQSFNIMTRQLFDARSAVEKNRIALENAKTYLESVLANMSAGVIVFDAEFRLVSCNASVERILLQDLTLYIGHFLKEITGLAEFSSIVMRAFSLQKAQIGSDDDPATKLYWQQQIEVSRDFLHPDKEHVITLFARGSNLPTANGMGYIVVFDDISDVISVQRSLAWGEVAQRLAHEIKNPLTPIQLSAERLQMKLVDKLSAADAAILNKGALTIVKEVASMKRMVDDFRDYAKTPAAKLSPLHLNTLIEEILNLYLNHDGSDVIHAALASNLPRVMGDEVQLRQVIHNLLQNAQDAVNERVAQANPDYRPRIDVMTEAVSYQVGEGNNKVAVRLSIMDNGAGFSAKMLACAFEPYVTSKQRGTGLGLPMVKKIVEEHGGRIDILNRAEGKGAKILILLHKLAE